MPEELCTRDNTWDVSAHTPVCACLALHHSGFQLSPALHRGTGQSSAVPASAAGIAWMAVWGDFSLLFPP